MNKRGEGHRAGPVEHAPGPIMEEEDMGASVPEQAVVGDDAAGWATTNDGRRIPISRETADAWWAEAEATKAKRASDMPTERDAIISLWSAYQRLKELDWNDAIYCPKDGSLFEVIEAGSTGVHTASYQGEWPNGHWWIHERGDMSPSRPILYRRTEAEKAKWEELRRNFAQDPFLQPQAGE